MKRGSDVVILNVIAYIFIGILSLLAVIPFIMLVSSSLQSDQSVIMNGYSLLPTDFDIGAYKYIFENPAGILRSYGITIFVTLTGTSASLFLSSMTAYALSRKDVRYRNKIAFFMFFTTLFSGGLVPSYILNVKYYHLQNTLTILLVSNLFNVMYILILRNNISNTIPDSISESAKIDGANDFLIFVKMIIPLLKPALASIGLFVALAYWNEWASAMLYINKDELYPLQYQLYKIISFSTYAEELITNNGAVSNIDAPKETLKLALTVVATGPIVLAYPFAQKYFIRGMTLGAVKG